MSSLDIIESLGARDPGDMYGAICSLPEQIRTAISLAANVDLTASVGRDPDHIILCGMGGSAIGGDIARSILADTLPIPMTICRDYRLPAYAGPGSLVIASSYSGATEETLAAFAQARTRGCRLAVLTTGGTLGDVAVRDKIPMVALPGGLQPRAAIGYSFVPLMMLFHQMGLSPWGADVFKSLAVFLEQRIELQGVATPSDRNPAKQLALKLYGRIPILYSGPTIIDVVALRIKGQINENAKMPAFANQFPEFNHNELVGWKEIQGFREFLRVILLRDREDHERVTARMQIVAEMIEKQGIELMAIDSEGENRLQRAFSLIQLGDFVSFYLALLNKVDPTPVEAIQHLKQELARILWPAAPSFTP